MSDNGNTEQPGTGNYPIGMPPEQPGTGNYPIGIPPEHPEKKRSGAAVILIAMIALLAAGVVTGAFLLFRAAYGRVSEYVAENRTERKAEKDAPDAANVPATGSDTTAKDGEGDETLALIREYYCSDFLEEEAVRVNRELVHTGDFRATVYYFFPACEEGSDRALAFFMNIENTGKETYAFFINDYHVNSRMINEEADVVELAAGQSENILFYLSRLQVKSDVKSAGFRFVVRRGGRTGNIDVFDEQFLFLAKGESGPAIEDRRQGKKLLDREDMEFRLHGTNLDHLNDGYFNLAFRLENRCDFAMNASISCYVNGVYCGRTKSVDVTGGCDRYILLEVDAGDREKYGIGTDTEVETLEVELELQSYTNPGTQIPWEPYLTERIEIPIDNG